MTTTEKEQKIEKLYKNIDGPWSFKINLENCIENRRKYFLASKFNILALLKKLPDELCRKIIGFANYEYQKGFWDGDPDRDDHCLYIQDNMYQIAVFDQDWNTFLNPPDPHNSNFVYDSDDEDDSDDDNVDNKLSSFY